MKNWMDDARAESLGYRTPSERKADDRGFIRGTQLRGELVSASKLRVAADELSVAFDLGANEFAAKRSRELGDYAERLGGSLDTWALIQTPWAPWCVSAPAAGIPWLLDSATILWQAHLRYAMLAYNYLNALRVLGRRHLRRAAELVELLAQATLLIELAEEAAASWLLEIYLRLADALPDAPEFALPRQTRAGPQESDPEESSAKEARQSTKLARHGRAPSLASPAQSAPSTNPLRLIDSAAASDGRFR